MADTDASPDLAAPRPALQRARARAALLVRAAAVLAVTNAALNLAGAVGGRGTAAAVFDAVVHGDLGALFLRPASPGAAWAGLRAWTPAARAILVLGWGLAVACLARMRLAAAAGLALAAALLVLTLRSTGADLWSDLAAADPLLLAAALGIYGAAIVLTVVRWQMLLNVQGIRVPFGALLRMTLIGVFFNLAIPGAVSGDLVKMGCIAARAGGRKAEGVLTILVDRVVGVLGLLVVASVTVACSLPLLRSLGEGHRLLRLAAGTVALGSAGGVGAVLLLEFREVLMRQPWAACIAARGAALLPPRLRDLIARLVTALDLYRSRRRSVLRATLLSVAVHVLLAADLYTLGKALGEESLGLHHYVIAASVANAVAAIPVTPGGVGTRDKTAAAFLTAFGARPAARAGSIPVALSLVIVFWALVGAAAFLAGPRSAPEPGPGRNVTAP